MKYKKHNELLSQENVREIKCLRNANKFLGSGKWMERILTYIDEAQRGEMEEPGPWRGYGLDVTFLGVGMRRIGDTENSTNTSKSYRSTVTNQAFSHQAFIQTRILGNKKIKQ